MLTEYFSNTNWYLATNIIGILTGLGLMATSAKKLIRGGGALQMFLGWAIIIFVLLYIGERPPTKYGDSYLYTHQFNMMQSGTFDTNVNLSYNEVFFRFIQVTCVATTDASGWMQVIAIFYVGCMGLAVYRWLPRHVFVAMIFMFTSFIFFAYGTNGIRNGMGTSIAMLGLSFIANDRKKGFWGLGMATSIIGFALILLAANTHTSCYLILAAAAGAIFVKDFRLVMAIWCVCVFLSLFIGNSFAELMGGVVDDVRMTRYTNEAVTTDMFSRTGFRWDFLLYSAVPIAIGWYAVVKRGIRDFTYFFLLNVYTIANCFWVLVNQVAYSNRFAYLSWYLYPLVLCYPFLKFRIVKQQGVILGLILIACVLFTIYG